MVKTMGVVVVILVALWLIFAVVGVVTALLKSIFVVLIVVAICYGAYHYFKKKV
jgi:membrane protein required for beta-lactamase induction